MVERGRRGRHGPTRSSGMQVRPRGSEHHAGSPPLMTRCSGRSARNTGGTCATVPGSPASRSAQKRSQAASLSQTAMIRNPSSVGPATWSSRPSGKGPPWPPRSAGSPPSSPRCRSRTRRSRCLVAVPESRRRLVGEGLDRPDEVARRSPSGHELLLVAAVVAAIVAGGRLVSV